MPRLTALIGQFVSDVAWGELDVLLIDTPPGTSDEHLAVVDNLKKHRLDGAVLVTTPQVSAEILQSIIGVRRPTKTGKFTDKCNCATTYIYMVLHVCLKVNLKSSVKGTVAHLSM